MELRNATIDGEARNQDAIIDVSNIVPFRLGLEKRPVRHESDSPLYRLILLHPERFVVLPTEAEKERERAEKERERAEKEKERAEKEKERAEKAEQRASELEEEVGKLKKRLNDKE